MPIYEYECAKCNQHFEYTQSIKDAPKTDCERCGGALSRLISAAGFILKGGGWYKDLYSKKPASASSSSSSSSPSSSSSSSSSSGESKSDAPAKSDKKE